MYDINDKIIFYVHVETLGVIFIYLTLMHVYTTQISSSMLESAK